MKNITRFLRDQSISAGSAVYNAANVDTIRLSVTGLSRAGKTVFMVSLISNLLAMGKGIGGKKFASLPLLANHLTDKSGACRLIGVEIEPSGLQLLPRFAYETFRDDLAKTNGASWPPFTDQPAMLTLRLLREQFLARVLRIGLLPCTIGLAVHGCASGNQHSEHQQTHQHAAAAHNGLQISLLHQTIS